jgi:hypothetical protein
MDSMPEMTFMVKKQDSKEKSKTKSKRKEKVEKADEKCGCDDVHEDGYCQDATAMILEKNPQRAYALRDLWSDSLNELVDQEIAPEPQKREMLFLALSNAMLDMMMDILPEELVEILAENLDDFLAVTLVNKKYSIDMLRSFQEEFEKEKGKQFDDEEKLQNALNDFQQKFWDSSRKDLRGKSPNQAVEEELQKYKLC